MIPIIVFDEEDKLKFDGDRDIDFDIYRLCSENVLTDSVMQKESLPEINYQQLERSFLDLCHIEQIPDQELNFSDFPIPSLFPSSFNQGKSVLNTIALSTSQNHLKTPERLLSEFSEGITSSPKSLIIVIF